jgi:hypothetical protein
MSDPARTPSVTDAARRFADVVHGALCRREATVLTKNGVAVAVVAPRMLTGIPASELAYRWSLMPHLSVADADALATEVAASRRTLAPPAHPLA